MFFPSKKDLVISPKDYAEIMSSKEEKRETRISREKKVLYTRK